MKTTSLLAQASFGTVGIVLLTYCALVLVDAHSFQQQETQILRQTLPAEPTSAIGPDGLVGRITISRLELSVIVMEGTGHRTLRRAAGHIPGTALPGQPGNIGISAHRDTFFRPLRHVLPDDLITLETASGKYRYRVLSTTIVKPDDLSVLAADGTEVLTLVTCYPFYFVGPAPSRFIVRAERIT
jgi:sortase A